MRSISGEQPAHSLPAALRVAYQPLDGTPLPPGVLAAIRFGVQSTDGAGEGTLTIDVGLDPLASRSTTTPWAEPKGTPCAELWFAGGPVHTGRWSDGTGSPGYVRYAHDEHYLFAVIELDERQHGGILPTTERVYAAIHQFQQQSRFPHMLRMWNYMDAINEGAGDLERYRQFCVGRGRGMGEGPHGAYPSATAVGRQRPDHLLQVFWLAGTAPGTSLENPRQVSAYHYPRVHGPVSPTFARALIAPDQTLLVSGTASIVGHVSQHHDDPMEQLEETVRNLGAFAPHVSRHRTSDSTGRDLLKVYIRDPQLTPRVAERLSQLYPDCDIIFVAADICRRELLLEIEAVLAG